MTKTINYDGKRYPIKLGYYALKHASADVESTTGHKLDFQDLLKGDLTILEPLLFYSLKMGHRLEKQVLELTVEDMEFVLDEGSNMLQFVKMIPEAFPETTGDSVNPPMENQK